MFIGFCGNCGGRVETDMEGIGHCRNCHASQIKNTIPMGPPPKPWPKTGEEKKSNRPPIVE